MRKIIDLTGERFGRLLVMEYFGRNKHKQLLWKCLCKCGNICIIIGKLLKNKHTKSCGCIQKEKVIENNKNNKPGLKHGLSSHKLYEILDNATQRCTNPKNPEYKNYGGRGIKVCSEWLNNKEAFIKYCLNLKEDLWQEGLEIDRINKDGNYECGNIRFVDRRTNAGNRRRPKNPNISTGVFPLKNGKSKAQIKINGKTKHIGTYNTAEEASDAYQNKVKEI